MTFYSDYTNAEISDELEAIGGFISYTVEDDIFVEVIKRLRDATEPEPEMLTTAQAAEYLNLDRQTIGRYGRQGTLTPTGQTDKSTGGRPAMLWLKSEVESLQTICQVCKKTVKFRHWYCPHCGASLK